MCEVVQMQQIMDFGELQNDLDFVTKVNKTTETLDNIEECVQKICAFPNYDALTEQEKVKCDLFSVYSINSLFWIYLKLQGRDITTHGIKNELSRIRQAMVREKDLQDRAKRPGLDVEAAKRFINHELKFEKRKKTDDLPKHKLPRKRKYHD